MPKNRKSMLLILISLSCSAALGQQTPTSTPAVALAVAPIFPATAFGLPNGGDAAVEITINAEGEVTSATPVQGSVLLYDASLKAARRWRFQPLDGTHKILLTFFFYPLPTNASPEDAATIFIPPYRVEIRARVPPSTVSPDNNLGNPK